MENKSILQIFFYPIVIECLLCVRISVRNWEYYNYNQLTQDLCPHGACCPVRETNNLE